MANKIKVKNNTESITSLLQETMQLINHQEKQIINRLTKRANKFKGLDTLEAEEVISKCDSEDLKLLDRVIEKHLAVIKVAKELIPKEAVENKSGGNRQSQAEIMKAIREESEKKKKSGGDEGDSGKVVIKSEK